MNKAIGLSERKLGTPRLGKAGGTFNGVGTATFVAKSAALMHLDEQAVVLDDAISCKVCHICLSVFITTD